jgi:hypothetical protein
MEIAKHAPARSEDVNPEARVASGLRVALPAILDPEHAPRLGREDRSICGGVEVYPMMGPPLAVAVC